jgi:L-rhamnose mutarotase
MHALALSMNVKRQVETMQRIAFTMKIKPGSEAEYRARHQQVWPAMLEQLKKAGCHNYSIYLKGLDLFAYMEVDDFQHYLAVMADSEVAQRWEAYMSDILIRETNPSTGFPDVLSEVFHLD